jgi:hypothetical protein
MSAVDGPQYLKVKLVKGTVNEEKIPVGAIEGDAYGEYRAREYSKGVIDVFYLKTFGLDPRQLPCVYDYDSDIPPKRLKKGTRVEGYGYITKYGQISLCGSEGGFARTFLKVLK